MSWDIYGNALPRGHCEVHPHIAESWPCGLCRADDAMEQERREVEERMYQKWMLEQQAIEETP